MMKTTVAGTSLQEIHKKFTNHSARKTTASKLKKANVECSDIVKFTGHRSVQSLDDYDEADEEVQYPNETSAEEKRIAVSDITTTGSTRSSKHERARTTHIGRPIDDSDE